MKTNEKVVIISETVETALNQRETKPLDSLKTKNLVGIEGKIIDLNITILEGEDWVNKRQSIKDNYPDKDLSFLDAESYNVKGSIVLNTKKHGTVSFYVSNDLLAMLLKAKALVKAESGYLPIDKVLIFGTNAITFVK